MNRRKFIQKGALTGSLFTLGGSVLATELFSIKTQFITEKHSFNLKYAPHDGMFKAHAGEDIIAQLEFMAAQGFTAFEDNEMRNRPMEEQNRIASKMGQLGMEMGVFVAHKIYWKEPNLASGKQEWRDEFLQYIKDAVEVAKRVNAKWMTVVPGHVDLHLDNDFQTANVVETLKRASDILEPHNLTMVLEPLNFRNHPGLFLNESPQAFQICKAVDSPSCKILFDIYHQQIQEGNLLPNIEACWDEIAYFQIGDNPGRNEPTTGEINYKNVFKYIYEKGYNGILGMEHGNSVSGKEGEQKVIDAYKKMDDFL
ncbi:MAG TPA: xylose isomerase [Flavobacteriaceae bacterium]|mgnify:FL=1|nr:xylose isomerase [Flavobacteriaceae bacterium]HAT63831.1 xylose isomerase [Flavobacteriaceae bacterium]|tara:strand:- start:61801 stop:62736 length:936 start_codon:yes stop_codon:yes gene_type:complete